jgi:hypothetical protein
MKIVVFDLDETLGYFTQYGIFLDCLKVYLNKDVTQTEFDSILDLYPEFLRPNILNILSYLKTKKESKCCHKMMIYTNNTGPREWAHQIINYFQNKINYKLVDQIIAAFKINGKQVEICRTTHNKTHNDFIRCTKLPASAEICFLDDYFYPDMVSDNIYYINIKPYYYDIPFEEMIMRFKTSSICSQLMTDINLDSFSENIMKSIKQYKYQYIKKSEKEYEIDKILGKQITTHLQEFFNKPRKNITLKSRGKRKNKTRKRF